MYSTANLDHLDKATVHALIRNSRKVPRRFQYLYMFTPNQWSHLAWGYIAGYAPQSREDAAIKWYLSNPQAITQTFIKWLCVHGSHRMIDTILPNTIITMASWQRIISDPYNANKNYLIAYHCQRVSRYRHGN